MAESQDSKSFMLRRLDSQIKDSQPDENYMFQEIKEMEGDDLDLNGIIR